jgi:hypothetical protein
MLLLLTTTIGCSKNAQLRKIAVRAMDQGNIEQLKADAAVLWAVNTNNVVDIPQDQWPASFLAFKPVRVWRYSDGISIIMAKFVSKTAGIFVVIDPNFIPEDKSNVQYELLTNGVYWLLTS